MPYYTDAQKTGFRSCRKKGGGSWECNNRKYQNNYRGGWQTSKYSKGRSNGRYSKSKWTKSASKAKKSPEKFVLRKVDVVDGHAIYQKFAKRGFIGYLNKNGDQHFRKETKEETALRVAAERDIQTRLEVDAARGDQPNPLKRSRTDDEIADEQLMGEGL